MTTNTIFQFCKRPQDIERPKWSWINLEFYWNMRTFHCNCKQNLESGLFLSNFYQFCISSGSIMWASWEHHLHLTILYKIYVQRVPSARYPVPGTRSTLLCIRMRDIKDCYLHQQSDSICAANWCVLSSQFTMFRVSTFFFKCFIIFVFLFNKMKRTSDDYVYGNFTIPVSVSSLYFF